ncbi:MAG: ABC transporter permease [Sulfurovum sp.]|nr:ABC transporter permease [Sulfurovum sp.]
MKNNYKDLLIELVRKEIKIRYKNSYLGYVWSIANPLMLAMVFYFVFQVITRMEMENYALFLVTGLFIWQWLANTITVATMLFVGNAPLIKKVNFPRNFLAIALVLSEGFNFFFSLFVVAAFMIYYSKIPSFSLLIGIPVMFLITSIFVYGLSLLIGTLNLFFRDLERLVQVFVMFMFYATPILYPVSMIPEKYSYLLYANPFTPFVISWREMLLNNTYATDFILISIVYALISLAAGTFVYNKLKYKFAELI